MAIVAAVRVVVDATINRSPMVSCCMVSRKAGGFGLAGVQRELGEAGGMF